MLDLHAHVRCDRVEAWTVLKVLEPRVTYAKTIKACRSVSRWGKDGESLGLYGYRYRTSSSPRHQGLHHPEDAPDR